MTIKEAHDYIALRLDKDQVGYFSHEERDDAINRAQLSHFMRLYSNPKEYQRGKPARFAAFHTQKIHDDLAPFKKRWRINEQGYTALNTQGTGPDGIIVLPSDYVHILSATKWVGSWNQIDSEGFNAGTSSFTSPTLSGGVTYRVTVYAYTGASANVTLTYEGTDVVNESLAGTTTHTFYFTATENGADWTYDTSAAIDVTIAEFVLTTEDEIEVLSEEQFSGRMSSTYLAPTSTEPILRQVEGGGVVNNMNTTQLRMQLGPRSGVNGELLYLRKPATVQYVYTMSGETETHDPSASTDPEWGDEVMGEILEEAIQLLAHNAQDQMGLGVSAQKKGEGV
jgi:hypothetical protein